MLRHDKLRFADIFRNNLLHIQSPVLTDAEGDQDTKSSTHTPAQQQHALASPEATAPPSVQDPQQAGELTLTGENPIFTYASTPQKPASSTVAEDGKGLPDAAGFQTPVKGRAEGVTREGRSTPAAQPKPCMYFLRTGTCDYGDE